MTRTLLIRGTEEQARAEAARHKVPIRELTIGLNGCQAKTRIKDEAKLVAWQQERASSLIWWGPKVVWRQR